MDTLKTLKLFSLILFLISNLVLAENISINLTQRQLCDLELLMNGGFHPLKAFMTSQEYDAVVNNMHLPDGTLWPIPITLDIYEKDLKRIEGNSQIALRDPEGFVLAYLNVTEIWKPNKKIEAEKVYGTNSLEHPGVNFLFKNTGEYYIAGEIINVAAPKHYDFTTFRKTPQELKELFKRKRQKKIVAFQTNKLMHPVQVEMTLQAAKQEHAHLLIHSAVGMTMPGDIDHFTRVKCYQKILPHYPKGTVTLNLLPIAMRMAGPKEALWNAIIQKNYGCTHFIVEEDDEFKSLAKEYSEEIGIEIITLQERVYVEKDKNYQPINQVSPKKNIHLISDQELREMLEQDMSIPEWYTFPEIVDELKKMYPPLSQQGFCLFMTGLSGSGKSTIANALAVKLMEIQQRPITILDGDIIRKHLSSELGFSKEHRSINVRRVGFVASEITKNKGIVICPMIAPYAADRQFNRNLINTLGNYIEIYVATPLNECEKRDTKGLYNLARQGKIKEFTGISDPYEEPINPEIIIDTTRFEIDQAVDFILSYLFQQGYLK